MQQRSMSAYVAEFIGTFFLVFSIVLVVSQYSQAGLLPGDFVPAIAGVHVLVLFMLISTLGAISGAHFNPAVTIALASLRKIKLSDAGVYILFQISGAIVGTLLAKAFIGDAAEAANYAANAINEKAISGALAGFGLEAVGTFMLVWAIVGVAINPGAPKEWAALTIGATLGLAVLLIAPLTGAGFNPARSIGPALVSGEWGSAKDFLVAFVAGPLVGALAAAQLYSRLALARDGGD